MIGRHRAPGGAPLARRSRAAIRDSSGFSRPASPTIRASATPLNSAFSTSWLKLRSGKVARRIRVLAGNRFEQRQDVACGTRRSRSAGTAPAPAAAPIARSQLCCSRASPLLVAVRARRRRSSSGSVLRAHAPAEAPPARHRRASSDRTEAPAQARDAPRRSAALRLKRLAPERVGRLVYSAEQRLVAVARDLRHGFVEPRHRGRSRARAQRRPRRASERDCVVIGWREWSVTVD